MKPRAWLLGLVGLLVSGCAASAGIHAETPSGGVLVLKGNREAARRAARSHMVRHCGGNYRVLAERTVTVAAEPSPTLEAQNPLEAATLNVAQGQELRMYYACVPVPRTAGR
jgi:hypothetical protein